MELLLTSDDKVGRHVLKGPWCNDWDLRWLVPSRNRPSIKSVVFIQQWWC